MSDNTCDQTIKVIEKMYKKLASLALPYPKVSSALHEDHIDRFGDRIVVYYVTSPSNEALNGAGPFQRPLSSFFSHITVFKKVLVRSGVKPDEITEHYSYIDARALSWEHPLNTWNEQPTDFHFHNVTESNFGSSLTLTMPCAKKACECLTKTYATYLENHFVGHVARAKMNLRESLSDLPLSLQKRIINKVFDKTGVIL